MKIDTDKGGMYRARFVCNMKSENVSFLMITSPADKQRLQMDELLMELLSLLPDMLRSHIYSEQAAIITIQPL